MLSWLSQLLLFLFFLQHSSLLFLKFYSSTGSLKLAYKIWFEKSYQDFDWNLLNSYIIIDKINILLWLFLYFPIVLFFFFFSFT